MKRVTIEMNGIGKIFETDEVETHALKNVSLKVYDGDFVSLSGPSGCGKSTLLSLLGLLDTPSSGEYKVDGINVSNLVSDRAAEIRNQKFGFIFQSFNLIDELSVFDNVALPLRYSAQRFQASQVEEQVRQCLARVGIEHRMNHKPNQLSGGQQQRVAIARALISKPSVILADEPTGNLDSKSGDAVMSLLGELNDAGSTIFMVTHDSRYADFTKKKIQMIDGQIVA
ncbi:ABC transporter ATP-binding protein [Rheinheimera sp. 4Y26]|uniref:ABC transporter ATP-binding protein n=1 Tax=Rheinheimera sp. 4Y26 TaxID=2977811 RepID=UPI0021B0982E|nr:ABC transporter ATP-binding protein [Rheinheimera sp. 4Y26]MCT6697965.1 ABC transporter ATP-binding protein [Rheinheimera sp. 4Y26]